jgi:hypothetical protein
MGQQQLLLIILGVIVVGIAVAVGITMFNDSAVSANRDAVVNDLVNLASRAQQFYRRPVALGGGGSSFASLDGTNGMKLLTRTSTSLMINGNGTYRISTAGTQTFVELEGIGNETGNDGTSKVKVTMGVWADSAKVDQGSGKSN